jgi:prophage regulatory protein
MIYRMRDLRAGRYPRGRATIYEDMRAGVMVPQVRLGARCVGWLAREVDAIVAARARGASDAEIRELVLRLIAERQRTA